MRDLCTIIDEVRGVCDSFPGYRFATWVGADESLSRQLERCLVLSLSWIPLGSLSTTIMTYNQSERQRHVNRLIGTPCTLIPNVYLMYRREARGVSLSSSIKLDMSLLYHRIDNHWKVVWGNRHMATEVVQGLRVRILRTTLLSVVRIHRPRPIQLSTTALRAVRWVGEHMHSSFSQSCIQYQKPFGPSLIHSRHIENDVKVTGGPAQ